MKKAIFIFLIISAFVDKCQPDDDQFSDPDENKGRKKKTTTTPAPERVNVTYENFDIPPQILVGTFRNILEKVSGYKRGVYCPFQNQNDCGRETALSGAIKRILTDEVESAKDPVLEKLHIKLKPNKANSKKRLRIFSMRSFEPVNKNPLNLKLYLSID